MEKWALAGVAQLVGVSSHIQNVAGWIPDQGNPWSGCVQSPVQTCMNFGSDMYQRQPTSASLSYRVFFSLPLSLSLSLKAIKKKRSLGEDLKK